MADFKNEVTFSNSRERLFDTCQRRYWYTVYLSWDGWWRKDRKPERRRAEAYGAKHVVTEAMLAGTIVHEMGQWALTEARDPGFLRAFGGRDGIREQMHSMANEKIGIALAQARAVGVRGSPKSWTRLLSVESGGQADEEFLRHRVASRIEAFCADDLSWDNGLKPDGTPRLSANLLMRAVTNPQSIVHCEELIEWNVPTKYGSIKTYLMHDLMLRSNRNPTECVLIDWKTGLPQEENIEQLEFYAAWASSTGWTGADLACVYLGDGITRVEWFRIDMKASVTGRIESFVEKIKERVVDGDLNKNVSIEEAFRPTMDLKNCKACQFAQMCERDGTKP